ncbi:MAG: hypothetical protein R2737_10270 [Candidatus Nanopelagicales bacterium]
MDMIVTYVDPVLRFSLEADRHSGRTFVGIEVRNTTVEYTEWYEVDRVTFARFEADPTRAHDMVRRAQRRELDHLLLLPPGDDRGLADA